MAGNARMFRFDGRNVVWMRVHLIERDFAFAAITTATAALAKMIIAGVLGAARANLCGLLFADAARKRH
jgi:hypothetical protein